MKNDQKLLLYGGAALIVICGFYIAMASIPNDAVTAMMFPLAILGLIFGILFLCWSVSWIVLEKVKIIK